MKDARYATFWSRAVLGFGVAAFFNGIMLVHAWTSFLVARPEYSAHEWPTFSRVLTLQTVIHQWLAAIGGAGLFIGGIALAVMQWRRSRAHGQGRAPLLGMMLCAVLMSAMGIAHYFHMTVTLSANNDLHMALSYLFFCGTTLAITFDVCCSIAAGRAGVHDAAIVSPGFMRAHRAVGAALLASAAGFLLTFVLKDAAWNPWPGATQKVFVSTEVMWVVLSQLYTIVYIASVRRHFGAARGARSPARKLAGSAAVLALAVAACAAAPGFDAHAAAGATAAPVTSTTAAIGGTGRIQPAGGVIVVSGPPGRSVEQVLVKEGERVRKGALLLTLADQPVRALERDAAAQRLSNTERQSIERRKSAGLELETAKLTLTQARAEAAAIAALDERTFPAREKRQRDNAVSQASVALQLATVRLDEARKASDAELRLARTQLKLAEAALLATRVVAPTDATVLEVHAQPGSSAGGPAVTLADTSRMYVIADFFEGDLPRLAAGQRVKVSNNALGQTLEGAIERIGRVIDPVNRLAKVWVRLDKPAPADRFIGMQVDVKVDGPVPARERS